MSFSPAVQFELADRTIVRLIPGDVIGRMARAALIVNDPRISEAHAFVSFRRGEFYLLSLRRMLLVNGKPVAEILLAINTVVELAEGVSLRVVALEKPATVLAIASDALGVRALGDVTSLQAGPPPRISSRFIGDADVVIWSSQPDAWLVRARNRPAKALNLHDTFDVGGTQFTVVAAPLATFTLPATIRDQRLETPLHFIVYFESIEIHRPNQATVIFGGVGGRIFSELMAFSGPVNWDVIAREVWGDSGDIVDLRHRWDVALGRLRAKLREADLRSDLIRADGRGQVQLVLHKDDQVVERM